MIDGVKIIKKKQFIDERGKIMRMLRVDDEEFVRFGEIYFSFTYPGAIKAWHKHKKMTLTYAAISGKIKLVLFDDRNNSPTKGNIEEIFLSDENYFTITIPPLIWNGFKSIENKSAIIANCTDVPHSHKKKERKEYNDPSIPYDWGIQLK